MKIVGILIIILIILSSCMDDDLWLEKHKLNIDPAVLDENRGLVIVNEGNFMYGNSSLTWYNISTRESYHDTYYLQNGSPMGDVGHSAVIEDGLLYVVVNNSGKIIIMNYGKYPELKLFEFTGKITGLKSPRYIKFLSDEKAYVSDLKDRAINIVNPQTQVITGKIELNNHNTEFYQHPTEQMISYGKYIFSNTYSYDNKILVIDTAEGKLTDSIEVFKQPSSMVLDSEDKLWVLCDGGYEGSGYGKEVPGLLRINAATRSIEKAYIFSNDHWPSRLNINSAGDTIYFINKDIWRMSIYDESLPEVAFIKAEDRLFFGLGVDPNNSDVYVSDAIDKVQNGIVYRYSSDAKILDTIQAGIMPGSFCF